MDNSEGPAWLCSTLVEKIQNQCRIELFRNVLPHCVGSACEHIQSDRAGDWVCGYCCHDVGLLDTNIRIVAAIFKRLKLEDSETYFKFIFRLPYSLYYYKVLANHTSRREV